MARGHHAASSKARHSAHHFVLVIHTHCYHVLVELNLVELNLVELNLVELYLNEISYTSCI